MTFDPKVLLKCSFAGIRFPIHSVRVTGGGRSHVHEYPHSPGGAPEKLGRKLYEFEVVPCFEADLIPTEYAGLWPNKLNSLQNIFDKQSTEDLILPTIGKVRAFAETWSREYNPSRSMSGEAVSWKFLEDSEESRLITTAIVSARSLPAKLDAFVLAGNGFKKPSLWDQIVAAVEKVLAYRDQFELYSNLIEASLLSILGMLREIDQAYDELKDPRNLAAAIALRELWTECRLFYADQKQLGLVTKHKRTKKLMDIGELSIWLYGESSKASELLSLNSFEDPFAIPAGFNVRYYQLTETLA